MSWIKEGLTRLLHQWLGSLGSRASMGKNVPVAVVIIDACVNFVHQITPT